MYTDAATAHRPMGNGPARRSPAPGPMPRPRTPQPPTTQPPTTQPPTPRPPTPRPPTHPSSTGPSAAYRPRLAPVFEAPTERITFAQLRPPAPARRPRRWLSLGLGVLVAVVLVVGAVLGGFWIAGRQDAVPSTAVVGSCLARSGSDSVAVVGCGDPAAALRVLARLDDRPQPDPASTVCAATQGATASYWKGPHGGRGTVLCLAPLTAA